MSEHIDAIRKHVESLEEGYDGYGGWPCEDEEAKDAMELAMRLAAMAWPCGVFGREYAEGGERRVAS
jgi:hypothetical protein